MIAEEENFTKNDVAKIIDKATEVIVQKVAEGEVVSIKNFGSFLYRERSERSGRNPRTGEPIIIEAHKIPYFRASESFKRILNK